MEHHLKIVAKNFELDEIKLTEFALKNPRKYGIEKQDNFVTTTTMFTEDLIKDFQNEQ